MEAGCAAQELKPAGIVSEKICQECGNKRPITNFASNGYHTRKDGTKICYRRSICRKCDKKAKVASGICKMCTKPAEPGKHHCQKHLDLLKATKRRQKTVDRTAAFSHYGRACQFCGETIELFLTIDHKNNDGAEHRKELRTGGTTHDIYVWLRRNNYPDEFQTLCMNCNYAKGIYGEEAVLEALASK